MRLQLALMALSLALTSFLLAGCEGLVSPIGEINDCNRIATIDLGETLSATLTDNDCTLADDAPVDYRAFEINVAGTVTVTLAPVAGDAFAPVLILYDEGGQELARTTGGLGATVTLTEALGAGAYAIGISSTSGFGTYELSLE